MAHCESLFPCRSGYYPALHHVLYRLPFARFPFYFSPGFGEIFFFYSCLDASSLLRLQPVDGNVMCSRWQMESASIKKPFPGRIETERERGLRRPAISRNRPAAIPAYLASHVILHGQDCASAVVSSCEEKEEKKRKKGWPRGIAAQQGPFAMCTGQLLVVRPKSRKAALAMYVPSPVHGMTAGDRGFGPPSSWRVADPFNSRPCVTPRARMDL